MQAFLNFAVKAEKKKGKDKSEPVYKKFKQFYDYEKELKEISGGEKKKPLFAGLSKFFKKEE